MLKFLFMIWLVPISLVSQECPPTDTIPINPLQNLWNIPYQNNWSGLEVMTWNIQQFPLSNNTVNYVNEIISDLAPDIIVFQELNDLTEFQNLTGAIPAYTFIHTNYGSEYGLDLGLGVRNDCVEIFDYETLFPYDGWEFAYRYPLKSNIRWSCGDVVLDFLLINVHFKCCDDGFERRLAASQILKDYIHNQIDSGQQMNIIVAGDFNDDIDEPQAENSLWPLVQDNEYVYFATTPIVGDNSQQSYPWPNYYASFIDHILISSGLFDENSASGEVMTLRIDDYLGSSTYQNHISDHRPVEWKIWIETPTLPEGLIINEIMQNPFVVSDTYGEWFELTNIGQEIINLNGLIIRDEGNDQHTINAPGGLTIGPGDFLVMGREVDTALNGGVQMDYVYSDFNLGNSWDEVIIEHPAGVVIDEVWYDNGTTFPDPEGASMMLTNPANDNNQGANWTTSTELYGDGDLGTPGASNNGSSLINMVIENISGWNLVGLPLTVDDSNYTVLFPDALFGTLYEFIGSYVPANTLVSGNGYWLRFNEAGSSLVSGLEINTLTVPLVAGWNLISGITNEVAVTDIGDPDGIIVNGTIYEFVSTYQPATSLIPGKGYWIRANADGNIILLSN